MRCNKCGKEAGDLRPNPWGAVGDPIETCGACAAPRPEPATAPQPKIASAVDRLRSILEWAADAIDPPDRRAERGRPTPRGTP